MKYLVIGGAGFIGCNAARILLEKKHTVIVFDNLSRNGSRPNLEWLRGLGDFEFVEGDVRDSVAVENLVDEYCDVDVIIHLAAQVAVTTSVEDPREDFSTNALGTFNVLEAVRQYARGSILLNASTNKVYGNLNDVGIVEQNGRYAYENLAEGVSENRSLDFHSPYGCSKGAADQYTVDYSRIYGLKTVNFRQSCIYGYRQFGVEDQGWVAWFTIATVLDRPITIYGDGKQTRDILFVDDLVDCYLKAVENIDIAAGKSYNVGGGPDNVLSLLELIEHLGKLSGKHIEHGSAGWRPGDQKTFVCDITRARKELGWTPQVRPNVGVQILYNWVVDNRSLFK